MHLVLVDWIVIAASLAVSLWLGLRKARKAGASADEFFLSGRSLTWWMAGTSMVATSFAADTPLLISGWVRDGGLWKNWAWWCFSLSGMLSVFLFSRWWRRGGIMTKAEIVELRYGGASASVLRGTLGVLHAVWTNTIILSWVLLAGLKIVDVLLGVNQVAALVISCLIALTYSTLCGLWGVVFTNLFRFALAMTGAITLGVLAWRAVGGGDGVLAAAAAGTALTPDTLRFFPAHGPGTVFDASFWTAPLATVAVYLGVSWWAAENVDGASAAVQLISAAKDERHGLLGMLWFNIAHYALRPWPWIMVGLASLILVPAIEVRAPVAGTVTSVNATEIVLRPDAVAPTSAAQDGGAAGAARGDAATSSEPALAGTAPAEPALLTVPLATPADGDGWKAQPRKDLHVDRHVQAGQIVARADPERAYLVMMIRYLPAGLLGLVVASLLAAFTSTVDTHINLAASFFVNDVYRRFLRKRASPKHYVAVGRVATVTVMAMAGLVAYYSDSIAELFLFFLAFLSGVGPVYMLRWMWWRVRASTELTAMLSSAVATLTLSFWRTEWHLGPFSVGGALTNEGRLLLVVGFSLSCSLLSMLFTRGPDPASLLPFYRRVRPMGAWGPVAALATDVVRPRELLPVVVGSLGGLATILGLMFGTGFLLLQRHEAAMAAGACATVGIPTVLWALRRLPTP